MKGGDRRRGRLLASAFLVGAMMGPPAWAQSAELGELIITAQKRPENVQDVPISITAVSGEELESAGVTSFRDLAALVPSLRFENSNNSRNSTVSLRGIGNSGANPGIEYSVGIFLDGVYLPGPSILQGDLVDISTIEVLRGPQGTLYGRNTPVGAVNINTRAPQQDFEALVTGGVGNYELRALRGYIGGGLSEDLAARVTFWGRSRDGYIDNIATGEDVGSYDGVGGRLRALWTPRDDLLVNVVAYYSNAESTTAFENLDPTAPYGVATPGFLAATSALGIDYLNLTSGDLVVQADDVTNDEATSYGASINAALDFAAGHTLTSITAWDFNIGDGDPYAADGLPQSVARLSEHGEIESFSQELRLASPVGGFMEYLAGLYLYRQTYDFRSQIQIGPHANRVFPFPSGPAMFVPGETQFTAAALEAESAALFGTLRFNVTEALRFSLGGRYVWEDKEGEINHTVSPGASPALMAALGPNLIGAVARSEEKFTWLVNAQYDLTPDVMAFASVATGYKAGGFNARRQSPGTPTQFEPESSIDYQFGIKSELFDRRLRFNLSLFHMVLSDFQESIINPVTRSGFLTGNAGERRVQGVEIDFAALAAESLTFSGGVTYLDAEFTDYSNGPCYTGRPSDGSVPGTCNYNGMTPSNSPTWKVNLSADYERPLTSQMKLEARLNLQYTSATMLDAFLDPRAEQGAMTLVNANIGISFGENWRAMLWGRNLTDEIYYQRIVPMPLAPFVSAGGTSAAQGFNGIYAEPRTFGVELSYRY